MHSDLIAKMGALDGPSREVDLELTTKFFGVRESDLHRAHGLHCYDFTASLDAAIALVERVLPPAWIRLDEWYVGEKKPADAAILPHHTPNETYSGRAANLPIALLIATLKALEARDG